MTELISIKDSSKHVDQEVKMHVWLTDKRSSGKIIFLQLRDGTAFFQALFVRTMFLKKFLKQLSLYVKKLVFILLVLFMRISVLTSVMKFKFQI